MIKSIVGTLVIVLALAGCAPAEGPAIPSATSSPSSAPPSPTPLPTEVPVARPTLDQLRLTPDGFAELPLGSDPATTDPALSIVELVSVECEPGRTLTLWEAVESDPITPYAAFDVAVDDQGSVTGIQVSSALISTDRGITVGSSRAEVLAAYPGIAIVDSSERFDVYLVEGTDTWMRITVSANASEAGAAQSEQDTVVEMAAFVDDGRAYLPSFHPIGESCL